MMFIIEFINQKKNILLTIQFIIKKQDIIKRQNTIKKEAANGLENIKQALIVQNLRDFHKNNIVNMDANNILNF
jgi:hypothetical protein